MLFCLIGATIILGAILGFGEAFFGRLAGQIVHGALSIACFTLVGAALWRFGWKIGLLDLLLVFIASNLGLRLHKFKEAVRFVIRSKSSAGRQPQIGL
jgi:hypothetical protein